MFANVSAESPLLVSDSDIEELAGITLGFSQEFWTNFLKGLLPEIFEQINQQVFQNQTAVFELKDLMTVYFTIDKFQIENITYDLNKTTVDLMADNNTMGLHIGNSSFHIYLKYDMDLDPTLVSDQGVLEVGYDKFNLDLVFGIGSQGSNKRIKLNVTTSHIGLKPED